MRRARIATRTRTTTFAAATAGIFSTALKALPPSIPPAPHSNCQQAAEKLGPPGSASQAAPPRSAPPDTAARTSASCAPDKIALTARAPRVDAHSNLPQSFLLIAAGNPHKKTQKFHDGRKCIHVKVIKTDSHRRVRVVRIEFKCPQKFLTRLHSIVRRDPFSLRNP